MNRYVEVGLLDDAMAGKRVAVVGLSNPHIRELTLANLSAGPGVKSVERANGRERITFDSGGCILLVHPSKSALRGHALDVLCVEGWENLTTDAQHEVRAAIGSGFTELIRA